MRTTLTLDDDIMKAIRRRAAQEGRPLKDIIAEAMRLGLAMAEQKPTKRKFSLVCFAGKGLQPGVRLDDRDALFDLMDGR